ncbi:hypothetical protein EOPP23_15765 [Endozoicomonas sp. OPT23]|nr:hypothetical protein [Endozoicomonas sp. OPT23]
MLAGCAGRSAKPVQVQQADDAFRTCQSIEQEIHFIETEINRLIPKTEKTGKNVGLGVAGMFFFPAWFFMDLSAAEQKEINAYRDRYNVLLRLASEKHCKSRGQEPIPEFRDKEGWQQYQQQLQMQQQMHQQQLQQMQQQMNHQQMQQQQQMQQMQQQQMQLQQQLMHEQMKNSSQPRK